MILSNHHIQMLCSADNCLYFQVDGASYCLSPWSMGLEYSVLVGNKWLPIRSDSGFQFLHQMKQQLVRSSLLDKFIESIPDEIRAKAVQFRHLQHTILRLMNRTRAAVDLADSNPVLLWIIAGKVSARELSDVEAEKLICGSQRGALKQLFPKNKGLSLKFSKRIKAAEYSKKEFLLVYALLNDDVSTNLLRHCRQVGLDVLEWFDLRGPALQLPLVKQLIAREWGGVHLCGDMQVTIYDALRFAAEIKHGSPMEALRRCSSPDQLDSLHDRWRYECTRQRVEGDKYNFPDTSHFQLYPPIAPGTKHIEPITCLCGVYAEGEEMHHCVYRDFADEIQEGNLTIYRVLTPERGTLSLSRAGNEYVIDQFALTGNKEPSDTSWKEVNKWVKQLNTRY